MRPITVAIFSAVLFAASPALAGENFNIEEGFAHTADVPASAAKDIEKTSDGPCFAESKTTARDALEATRIDLGNQTQALLLKPKLPSEDKAAWGCFCGAYSCPMWIYSSDAAGARRIWSSAGSSVEIVDHKDNGSKRLLVSSGSAGHQEAVLYGWNGGRYKVLRNKAVVLGQGAQVDHRAKKDMAKFLKDAVR